MALSKIIPQAIRYPFQQKGSLVFNLLDYLLYTYKRNNWMLRPSFLWRNFKDIEIDRPVFLLGTSGGGLTLVSRMIRRHKDFVSVSGNYKYWSGADEMQIVLGRILPAEFAGIKHKLPPHPKLEKPTSLIYASNEFLHFYRKTPKDYSPELAEKFKRLIRWTIARHAIDTSKARFTDKSQTFTLKVSFLAKILEGANPMFILVSRNPYAICWRDARSILKNHRKLGLENFRQALKVSSQNWTNSVKCALKDSKEVENFLAVRFEDVLIRPERTMKRICDFIEIKFDKELLPQAHHKIPLGSRGRHKWYPLRPQVNEKYFEQMTPEDIEIIDSYVGNYARRLGYKKP